ncbi:hypothetical protein D918_06093 [Trichuris suis]|nr:hypothetical protein D918_06093 [Trichuris suis]
MCSTLVYANTLEGKSTACSENDRLEHLSKHEENSAKVIVATECQRKAPSATQPKETGTPKLAGGMFTPSTPLEKNAFKTSPEKSAGFIGQICWPLRGINRRTLQEAYKKRKNAGKQAAQLNSPLKPFPSLITNSRDKKSLQPMEGLNSLKTAPSCNNVKIYGKDEHTLNNAKPSAGYDSSLFEDRISVTCIGTSLQRNLNCIKLPMGNRCSPETKISSYSFRCQPTTKAAKNKRKRVRPMTASQPTKTYRENRASIMRTAAIREKIKSKASAS